jgi:hypothetical protein
MWRSCCWAPKRLKTETRWNWWIDSATSSCGKLRKIKGSFFWNSPYELME